LQTIPARPNTHLRRNRRRAGPTLGGAGRGARVRHEPGVRARAVPPRGPQRWQPGWLPLGRRPEAGAAGAGTSSREVMEWRSVGVWESGLR
jgi:hypothetical protein